MLVDHHVRSEPSPISVASAVASASAETTAGTGKEDLKAVRPVRQYKEVGLQEWLLVGRATVPHVLYSISLRMSLRQRMIHSKRLRAPARVDLVTVFFNLGQKKKKNQSSKLKQNHKRRETY